MCLPPAQYLVFLEGVFLGVKRYVRASEMLAGLTGHIYSINIPKSVIQFRPVGFVPTLHGTPTGWDITISRWDPFHVGSDG